YRRELAESIGQGSLGDTWLKSKLGRFVVTHVDLGRSTARKDAALMRSAPAVGLLTSLTNDRAAQMRVGQAFERLALTATTFGVSVQPLSATLELPLTRAAVAQLVPETVFPQHVFRLGYADRERRRSPRRLLAEVLSADDGGAES